MPQKARQGRALGFLETPYNKKGNNDNGDGAKGNSSFSCRHPEFISGSVFD
jgi:hypothetical protein